MTDLVDQMFPPINRKWASEYTDFNFWKAPVVDIPLPDLSPPSPALSARSDTSNQSTLARLRNFSLVGNRQSNNMKQFSLPPPASDTRPRQDIAATRKDGHLRQMSSLERISSTIASLATSSSTTASPRSGTPTYIGSSSEDEEEYDDQLEKGRRHRPRTRSISSMPGSLPGSNGSDDEMEFEVDDEGEYQYEGEEEPADDAFDEDLLAAGEMKDVPFL